MNALQTAMQIRHILRRLTWPNGGSAEVFGDRGAFVYAGTSLDDGNAPGNFPFALIWPGSGSPDDDEPDFVEQQATVVVAAEVAGGVFGEFSLTGRARSDVGTSANAGVMEVAGVAMAAVSDLVGADGVNLHASLSEVSGPTTVDDGRQVSYVQFAVTGMGTGSPHYAAPRHVRPGGSGLVWEGAHCEARYDFLRYHVVRSADGTAINKPSDGTTVYIGTDRTSPSQGGTHVVFAEYDPHGSGVVAGHSLPEVGSARVV